MESKDLLHPENDANQANEVNPGVSQETPINEDLAQEISEEQSVVTPEIEPKVEPEATSEVEPETVPALEPVAISEMESEVTPAVEPALISDAEPVAAVEEEARISVEAEKPEADSSVSEMIADIEDTQAVEEQEEEDKVEEVEDSEEKIESDYANLNLEEAIDILSEIVKETNYSKIKLRVGILKAKILQHLKVYKQEQLATYLQDGGNKDEFIPEMSEAEKKFNAALHAFKVNKAKYIEQQEAEKQKNLEAKLAIIERLKELVETESNLKILNDNFKQYQEAWKEIGPVPQNESTNLWQNYHFYVEKFFDILRINKELRYLDLKKNLELKINLCEVAESLLLKDSINQSFKALQQLHDEWKEIGPVPEDKKEEIWERFKNASDQINARRREHYDKLYEEQQHNYNAKVVLCEQTDELIASEPQTVKEYNEISDKLAEILKVWKTLGPAPSKLNDEIWTRFKSSLDKFFEAKKDYFQGMKDVQMQNYNLKLNIAIMAEGISTRTDWKQATEEILNLQKEWKEIGATPRKYSETIWKRFRTACDKFFEAKSNYFENVHEIEADNLQKKEDLIKRIVEHQFSEEKSENLDAMKAYQREWTELGHVPKKDKDRIYNEYREAINNRFAELKMSVDDIKRDRFKSKIDTILNNPNADRLIDKEKRFLVNKMNQLKEDVILWENNLGFFAHSKNADVLKAEFLKKINAAKEEVKDLEYKIRMMDKEAKEERQREKEAKEAKKEESVKEEVVPEVVAAPEITETSEVVEVPETPEVVETPETEEVPEVQAENNEQPE